MIPAPATTNAMRLGILLLVLGIVTALSWKLGVIYAKNQVHESKRNAINESVRVMEERHGYLRKLSVFPDFALVDVSDSSETTLYRELQGGGLVVYLSPDCSSCDETVAVIGRALESVTDSRRISFVFDLPLERVHAWRVEKGVELPCYQDRDHFVMAGAEFTVIPFSVNIDSNYRIIEYSAGAWTEADYVRMMSKH